jgi:NtrC-family two-component system sensor histidine kinase KinB
VVLSNASSEILKENYRSIIAAENMIDSIERQDSAILLAIIGFPQEGKSQFSAHDLSFIQWLTRAKDNITITGEAETVALITESYSSFRDSYLNILQKIEQSKVDIKEHGPLYKKDLLPRFLTVREACEKLRKMNEETMYAASQRASSIAGYAIWSTGLVAFLVLITSLLSGSVLVERIVEPLRKFVEATRQIASGHYDIEVSSTENVASEIALLSQEFNSMALQLKQFHELNFEKILEEKRKNEAVLSSIKDGLIVLSQELNVVGINLAAREILGFEFSDCLNREYKDILPEKVSRLLETESNLFEEKESTKTEQNVFTIHKGDKTRHFLFSITMIPGLKEEKSGYVILFKDVTDFREIEKLKDEFISAASHELRTPLTSIKMSLSLLKEKSETKLNEKEKELLQITDEEISRMKALVDDLLDLSKIEAGKIEMEFTGVEIKPLITHAEKIFRSQLEQLKASMKIEIPDDLAKVRADSNKITWVITNLISNALRYIPKNGLISIRAEESNNFVTISVKDNGKGIPLEYQSKIFQKFARVNENESSGTGLGLAICKEIIRAHGGTIWVDSAPGKGSCFYFTIPVM